MVVTPALPLTLTGRDPVKRRYRRLWRRSVRWLRRPRPVAAGRRLAALGVAGLMAAWALILAFVGGLKLARPGDGKGPMLLTGSGLMAAVSLAVWVVVIGRTDGSAVVLKVLQVASAVVAFGTLAWGILHHEPARDPVIVLVAASAFALSWMARAIEKKRSRRGSHRAMTGVMKSRD